MSKLKSLEERRQYMLDICQAVHDFCIENKIFYSLSCGTLIGAYRHKGFIPWDDDFDIMMTRENYDRFVASFQHPRYKLMTCFNSVNHFFAFARVVDADTYSLTRKNIYGKRNKKPGICVDLYIVENVPEDEVQRKQLFSKILIYNKIRKYTRKVLVGLQMIGLSDKIGFFYPLTVLCRQQYSIMHYVIPSSKMVCYAGDVADTTILERDLFDAYQKCKFENREFLTIKKYSIFLTRIYGNWMVLPPEEKRVTYHGGEFYIND